MIVRRSRHFKARRESHRSIQGIIVIYAQELFRGLLASFTAAACMKKPLDFDAASNRHNAILVGPYDSR